ncbi:MAG: hypothetical protein ACYDDB_04485 [bacterium]
MYKNLIYIEEYDIYQYFDGEKSFFSHDFFKKEEDLNAVPSIPVSAAVISKNINFSNIPKNGVMSAKKSGLNKYLAKYYRNESYFVINNGYNEYGLYHTLPLNIKKYYSLSPEIDFVIPYDYLVILFLNEKSIIKEQGEGALIFIEKTEGIYKIMVILNGFNLFPVISFKEDMLNDNLNLLKAKLNLKGIKIDKIISNDDGMDFNILFSGGGIINFTLKDFFKFFSGIKKSVPHFENLDIKFKTIEIKKNRLINLYIAALVAAIFFMQSTIIFFNHKLYTENKRIKLLNNNIAGLSEQIYKKERKILFNKHFMHPNIVSYLKRFILILPEGVKIKDIDIIKSKNNYVIKGTAFDGGGYRKFAKDYNIISQKSISFGSLRIFYNLDKFGRPLIKFYGKLFRAAKRVNLK